MTSGVSVTPRRGGTVVLASALRGRLLDALLRADEGLSTEQLADIILENHVPWEARAQWIRHIEAKMRLLEAEGTVALDAIWWTLTPDMREIVAQGDFADAVANTLFNALGAEDQSACRAYTVRNATGRHLVMSWEDGRSTVQVWIGEDQVATLHWSTDLRVDDPRQDVATLLPLLLDQLYSEG